MIALTVLLISLIMYLTMAIVSRATGGVCSDSARKKFSKPCEFGELMFGVSDYGLFNRWSGVYQMRRGAKRRIQVRMSYPECPVRTGAKIAASKLLFKNAMAAWALQPTPARAWWNYKGNKIKMHGMNLFIKEYILAH